MAAVTVTANNNLPLTPTPWAAKLTRDWRNGWTNTTSSFFNYITNTWTIWENPQSCLTTAVLTTKWLYPADLINIYATKATGPDHLTTTMI